VLSFAKLLRPRELISFQVFRLRLRCSVASQHYESQAHYRSTARQFTQLILNNSDGFARIFLCRVKVPRTNLPYLLEQMACYPLLPENCYVRDESVILFGTWIQTSLEKDRRQHGS
jgi:hypothetical protein